MSVFIVICMWFVWQMEQLVFQKYKMAYLLTSDPFFWGGGGGTHIFQPHICYALNVNWTPLSLGTILCALQNMVPL